MPCNRVEEIRIRLLSAAFSHHLQYYIDRLKADPKFLSFHANSTVLRLRVELELHSDVLGPCDDCPINAVAKCDILEALTRAMEIRAKEQEGAAA